MRTTALYAQDQWTLRTDDAAGRGAIRQRLELLAGADDRSALINGQTFLATPLTLRPNRRRQLQGHLAARRSGAGRLRKRQDGPQGQLRQVHGSGEQPERQLLDLQSDRPHRDDGVADVDRQRHRRAGHAGYGDFIPQCDLTNNAANGECAATTATTFGTAPRTTAAIDPNLLIGWGVRPRDWQFGVSVQQQLLPRVSVEVGYFKRWLQNFTATDNLAGHAGRLHAVQHHRAVGSAAARRRRLRGRRLYNVVAGRVRCRPATTSRSPTTSAAVRRASTACCSTSARESRTA